jgi:4-amino-4-deoxy-L-arabinose transferase-like glycosyltransferase
MAQRPTFDTSKLGTADGILLIAGGLYFIDSFLPWNRLCIKFATVSACGSANLWHGVGIIAALLAIALVVVAAIALFTPSTMAIPPLVVPVLAAGILLFSILKILIDNDFLSYGAWIGLVLSVVIAYGGYMKYRAAPETASAPPAPPAPPMA